MDTNCTHPLCNRDIEFPQLAYKANSNGPLYCIKAHYDEHVEYEKAKCAAFTGEILERVSEIEKAKSDYLPPTQIQVGGSHYKNLKIQPIKFTMENNLNFCQGNVVKYVTRYKDKNGLEDLKKARHYIDLLIEHEYGVQNGSL